MNQRFIFVNNIAPKYGEPTRDIIDKIVNNQNVKFKVLIKGLKEINDVIVERNHYKPEKNQVTFELNYNLKQDFIIDILYKENEKSKGYKNNDILKLNLNEKEMFQINIEKQYDINLIVDEREITAIYFL